MSKKTLVTFRTWRDISLVVTAARSLINSGHNEADILFIDDASEEDHANQLANIFPEAHVKRLRKRLEYCRCYNYAAKFGLKKGYLNLLILNNDSRNFSPNFVSTLEGRVKLSAGTFAVGPKVLDFDGGWLHQGAKEKLAVRMDIPTEGYLLELKSFLSLGGFSKELYRYLEDIDLMHRASKVGLNAAFEPNAQFEHLGNGSSRIQAFVPYYFRLRNLIWFLKKHKTMPYLSAIKTIARWSISSLQRAWTYRTQGIIFLATAVLSLALGIIAGIFSNGLIHD